MFLTNTDSKFYSVLNTAVYESFYLLCFAQIYFSKKVRMPNNAETSQQAPLLWVAMLHCCSACIHSEYSDHCSWIPLILSIRQRKVTLAYSVTKNKFKPNKTNNYVNISSLIHFNFFNSLFRTTLHKSTATFSKVL